MAVVQSLTTSTDFWLAMVIPDYAESRANESDLRRALHAANSLFHMHDWVFHTYKVLVQPGSQRPTHKITYIDLSGNTNTVSSEKKLANELEQQNHDFGRIRGIANAAKHLKLTRIRLVPNAPADAANTRIKTTGYGQRRYGAGPYGGAARVMLEGANGDDMEFSLICDGVYEMWESLIRLNSWK